MSAIRRVAVLMNFEKPHVHALYQRIQHWAEKRQWEIVSNAADNSLTHQLESPFGIKDPRILAQRFKDSQVLITIGGDGTLLFAAQVAAQASIPVLSINLGSLGFHTQTSPENLDDSLHRLEAGNYIVEDRMLLTAGLYLDSKLQDEAMALNDFVVAKNAWGHMIALQLTIDGSVASDISADALILASPTGSSAYNYAAGGPVVYPSMDAIVLNALCAHRMRVSPLVVPGASDLQVILKLRRPGEKAQILNDGQPWQTISDGEVLKISKAAMYLRLIVFENDFYGKLRDKLRWGGLL